jgi:hypothetical protein
MKWLTAAIYSILLATRVDYGKIREAQNVKGTTYGHQHFPERVFLLLFLELYHSMRYSV